MAGGGFMGGMMGGAASSVIIKIIADTKGLNTGIQQSKQKLGELKKSTASTQKGFLGLNKGLLSGAMAFTAVAVAVGATIKIMQASIKAFTAQEQAEARLEQAMKNQNTYTKANFESLKLLARQLQRTTVFSDEQTISATAMLMSFKFTTEQAYDMIPLLHDVATMTARTTGSMMDLEGAAKLVGLAMEGQAGRLKVAGISVSDLEVAALKLANREQKAAIVMKILESNSKDLAKATGETTSAAFAKLNNTVGDFLETLGGAMAPALADTAGKLDNLIWVLDQGVQSWSDHNNATENTLATYRKWGTVSEVFKQALNVIDKGITKTREETLQLQDSMQKNTEEIIRSETPIKKASDAFTELSSQVKIAKEQMNAYKTAIAGVKAKLDALTGRRFAGETEADKGIIKSQQEIRELKLEQLKLTDKESTRYADLQAQIEEKERLLDIAQLQREIDFETQRENLGILKQQSEDNARTTIQGNEDIMGSAKILYDAQFSMEELLRKAKIDAADAEIAMFIAKREYLTEFDFALDSTIQKLRTIASIKIGGGGGGGGAGLAAGTYSAGLSSVTYGEGGHGEVSVLGGLFTKTFAKGGIVNKPTMGLLGESGPEAVVPLGKSGGMGNQNVTVYIDARTADGAEIARKLGDYLNTKLVYGGI